MKAKLDAHFFEATAITTKLTGRVALLTVANEEYQRFDGLHCNKRKCPRA